ncbi:MAG TPA: hypothetical protein VNT33_16965 [Telluria sp.]|nr:hypothetical protein [Telluria sp.]
MPLIPVLADLLGRAYFDIASDLKPDAIEKTICEAIANTPSVFGHIVNPTPRMQRALLAVIHTRLRRSCGGPHDLVRLLIEAYRSPHTIEAVPGLRAAVEDTRALEMPDRVHALLAYLADQPAAFGVLENHGS